jgi:hypothetical protein
MKTKSIFSIHILISFSLIILSISANATTKISDELYRQLASNNSLELIVEYDDSEIESTITRLRDKSPGRRDDNEIRNFKASNYKKLKDQIDHDINNQEIEEIETYSHLPISLKRFKSIASS